MAQMATRKHDITAEYEIFARKRMVLQFTVLDADGAAVNITGFNWRFVVKAKGASDGDIALVDVATGSGITTTNGAAGILQVVVAASAMALDVTKPMDYELSRTDADNEGVGSYGAFVVRQSPT